MNCLGAGAGASSRNYNGRGRDRLPRKKNRRVKTAFVSREAAGKSMEIAAATGALPMWIRKPKRVWTY